MEELKISLKEFYQLERLAETTNTIVYRSDDIADDIYGEHGVTIAQEQIEPLLSATSSVIESNYEMFCELFRDDPAMMSEHLAQTLGYSNIYEALEGEFETHDEFIAYYLRPIVEEQVESEETEEPEIDYNLEEINDLPEENAIEEDFPAEDPQPNFNLGNIIQHKEEVPEIPRRVTLNMINDATQKFEAALLALDEKMSNITEVIDFINDYRGTIEAGYSEYLRVFDTSGKFVGFEKSGKSIELLNAIKEFDSSVNLGDLDPSQLLTASQRDDTLSYVSDISPEVCKAFIMDAVKNAETDENFIFLSHVIRDLILFTRRYYGEFR